MKTPLEKAGDHCLAAAKELRAYINNEDMDPSDPHLQFCLAYIDKLTRAADRLNPPKEEWPHRVVPFRPRSRTTG